MNHAEHYLSPLGNITLTSNGEALTGLFFDEHMLLGRLEEKKLPIFDCAEKWLDAYFAGRAPDFIPPLSLSATPFCKSVWEIALSIPYGETTTYGKIAAEIAQKNGLKTVSARAVGNALGRNPIALIVPCHRVIGANGRITGYAAGIDKKVWLLKHEGVL